MRILVAEDRPALARSLSDGLRDEGYVVDLTLSGTEADHLARANPYDCAVLDIMLPGMEGWDVLSRMRAAGVKTPVLLLTARDAVADRVAGLDAGADDYLTKPFSFAELVARLHALVRRATTAPASYRLAYADVSLDIRTRRVERAGTAIHLQAKEFALLEYLLRNPERVLSKTMILEHVWEYGFDPQTNVVDVLVSRLRAKVDRDFTPKLIHTLRGAGYVLRAEG